MGLRPADAEGVVDVPGAAELPGQGVARGGVVGHAHRAVDRYVLGEGQVGDDGRANFEIALGDADCAREQRVVLVHQGAELALGTVDRAEGLLTPGDAGGQGQGAGRQHEGCAGDIALNRVLTKFEVRLGGAVEPAQGRLVGRLVGAEDVVGHAARRDLGQQGRLHHRRLGVEIGVGRHRAANRRAVGVGYDIGGFIEVRRDRRVVDVRGEGGLARTEQGVPLHLLAEQGRDALDPAIGLHRFGAVTRGDRAQIEVARGAVGQGGDRRVGQVVGGDRRGQRGRQEGVVDVDRVLIEIGNARAEGIAAGVQRAVHHLGEGVGGRREIVFQPGQGGRAVVVGLDVLVWVQNAAVIGALG